MEEKRTQRRNLPSLVLLLALAGCSEDVATLEEGSSAGSVPLAGRFEPATAGQITGRVVWEEILQAVPPLEIHPSPFGGPALSQRQERPNPNAPRIDSTTRGIAQAVVYLRHVDAERSKPWDLPPARVEMRQREFHIYQGGIDSNVGFVRRGEKVAMLSRDDVFQSVHGRGACYFGLVFPDAGSSRDRLLDQSGLVELSNGNGLYWMRAYLLVGDHPYYTRTDSQGRFRLASVPPGRHDVVAWLPNWRKAGHDRDPESGVICRYVFERPLEKVRVVEVAPSASHQVDLTLRAPVLPSVGPKK